jgi:hypothetical protein
MVGNLNRRLAFRVGTFVAHARIVTFAAKTVQVRAVAQVRQPGSQTNTTAATVVRVTAVDWRIYTVAKVEQTNYWWWKPIQMLTRSASQTMFALERKAAGLWRQIKATRSQRSLYSAETTTAAE